VEGVDISVAEVRRTASACFTPPFITATITNITIPSIINRFITRLLETSVVHKALRLLTAKPTKTVGKKHTNKEKEAIALFLFSIGC
jgi:hypothetical protein